MRDLRAVKNSVYVSDEQFNAILKEKGDWQVMCDVAGVENLPTLQGGLDDIVIRKNAIYYTDRGCNGRDSSFAVIRMRKNN